VIGALFGTGQLEKFVTHAHFTNSSVKVVCFIIENKGSGANAITPIIITLCGDSISEYI
jgi:hypothetical protein